MLEFNSLKFSKRGSDLAEGHHGFYSMNGQKGIHLYKPDGEAAAYIVNNRAQGQFVVTAFPTPEGTRYMQSTCSDTEKWLNIDGISLLREVELIDEIRIE